MRAPGRSILCLICHSKAVSGLRTYSCKSAKLGGATSPMPVRAAKRSRNLNRSGRIMKNSISGEACANRIPDYFTSSNTVTKAPLDIFKPRSCGQSGTNLLFANNRRDRFELIERGGREADEQSRRSEGNSVLRE